MAFEVLDILQILTNLEEELAEDKLDADELEELYFELEELVERYTK